MELVNLKCSNKFHNLKCFFIDFNDALGLKWEDKDDSGSKNVVRFKLENNLPYLKVMDDSDKKKGFICEGIIP